MTSVIDVQNVQFAYDDRPVLDDISLSIEEGEFLGLIGPNGSGKTTLLEIMLGLRAPDAGRIDLFATPVSQFTEGTRLGYVSQQSSAPDSMMPVTVREVVTMGRYPHVGWGRLGERDRAVIDDALAQVGIADLAHRRISRLSGGQKQRAYIARALASEAELLALDEPTVGVDAESAAQFYDLLEELNADGITIVLIEHDLGIVADRADTIACLDGELHAHCEADAFLESDVLERVYGSNRLFATAAGGE